MPDAKVTEKDTDAAVAAFEKEPRGWTTEKIAQAIANARAAEREKAAHRTQHDGDCTIYAALHNGCPEDGICTCGYGWWLVRRENWSEMYSQERRDAMARALGETK